MTFILGLLPRAEAEPIARAAIRRGIVLDERLPEAHATLGALEGIEGNPSAAERAFRHALMLDPNDATSHHWYAMHHLAEVGRFEDALSELRRAQDVDPLALIVSADVAAVYYMMRGPARAIEQCRLVLELDPRFARAHLYSGWVHSQNCELDRAVSAFEAAKRLDASPWVDGWLGYGYGRAGRRADAEQILGQLRQLSRAGIEVAYALSLVFVGLGELERAVSSLEQASTERSLGFRTVSYMSAFDPLRSDPRFQDLLRRMNFPE